MPNNLNSSFLCHKGALKFLSSVKLEKRNFIWKRWKIFFQDLFWQNSLQNIIRRALNTKWKFVSIWKLFLRLFDQSLVRNILKIVFIFANSFTHTILYNCLCDQKFAFVFVDEDCGCRVIRIRTSLGRAAFATALLKNRNNVFA